jgi:hypothetical protein
VNDVIELTCPYCGEDVELVVDEGGDPETGWSATLRTGDE